MLRAPTAEPLPKRRGARIAARHRARRHVAQSREEAIRAVGRARAPDRVPAADRSVAEEPGRADPAPVLADPALDRDERLSRDSPPERAELARLRKDNRELRMERRRLWNTARGRCQAGESVHGAFGMVVPNRIPTPAVAGDASARSSGRR